MVCFHRVESFEDVKLMQPEIKESSIIQPIWKKDIVQRRRIRGILLEENEPFLFTN